MDLMTVFGRAIDGLQTIITAPNDANSVSVLWPDAANQEGVSDQQRGIDHDTEYQTHVIYEEMVNTTEVPSRLIPKTEISCIECTAPTRVRVFTNSKNKRLGMRNDCI
jgi:hypothetical protein